MECGRIHGELHKELPKSLGTPGPPIIPGTGKATDFKCCRNIHRFDRNKNHENVGNSSRGRSQDVPKIFRASMYRAHCAVIFAIAQLSCQYLDVCQHDNSPIVIDNIIQFSWHHPMVERVDMDKFENGYIRVRG